jgi:hypothetical protein
MPEGRVEGHTLVPEAVPVADTVVAALIIRVAAVAQVVVAVIPAAPAVSRMAAPAVVADPGMPGSTN